MDFSETFLAFSDLQKEFSLEKVEKLIRIEGDEEIIKLLAYELVFFCKIRPFSVDLAVKACILVSKKYKMADKFREHLVSIGIKMCPKLIYELYSINYFEQNEVIPMIIKLESFDLAALFSQFIPDFFDVICEWEDYEREWDNLEPIVGKNCENISDLAKYGCLYKSLEYCLKYDDIAGFQILSSHPSFNIRKRIKNGIFEWSNAPLGSSLISYAAFFGSISLFKYLLLNGGIIDDDVLADAVSSGKEELVQMCISSYDNIGISLANSLKYRRDSIFDWLNKDQSYVLDIGYLFENFYFSPFVSIFNNGELTKSNNIVFIIILHVIT